MKKLFLALSLLMSIQFVHADCTSSGMEFYPLEKNISCNAMFIIEGYLMSIKTIKSFKNRKVYLQSESGAIVELKLREILYSQMHLAQAIFTPVTTLQPNTKYYLKYENQTAKETADMQSRSYKNKKPLYWITNATKNSPEITETVSANFEKSSVNHYGCGPAVYAIFKLKKAPQKQTWYRTELLDVATNTKTVYYIRSKQNTLRVGHGMCSGEFSFSEKGTYKVRFTPINSDGKAATATKWITFKSPFEGSIVKGF